MGIAVWIQERSFYVSIYCITEISENIQKTIDNNMSSCGIIFGPFQSL